MILTRIFKLLDKISGLFLHKHQVKTKVNSSAQEVNIEIILNIIRCLTIEGNSL